MNGVKCPNSHPPRCNKYTRFGTGKKGCKKGKNCQYFHPILCKFSVKDRRCPNDLCTFPHLVGTKRGASSKNDQQKRPRSQSNRPEKADVLDRKKRTYRQKNRQSRTKWFGTEPFFRITEDGTGDEFKLQRGVSQNQKKPAPSNVPHGKSRREQSPNGHEH